MRSLFRWFQGYIQIRLMGRQINRMLNLCTRNHIGLWNITRDMSHYMNVHIRLRDFYFLKPFLRKTKTKLRIIGRHGFPFWCYRHPRLKWFPVLLVILLCGLLYSGEFIWDIRISGNDRISEYQLLQALEEQEIAVGKKSKAVDCAALEYELRNRFSDIGWVSVYMDKKTLCVDIRESLYGHQDTLSADGKRYDFVANRDAYIYSMVTRAGTANVSIGEYVRQGDVLIEGTYPVYDDTGALKQLQQVRADAYILGDVEYEFIVPITEMEIVSLRIADAFHDQSLYRIGNAKISRIIRFLEEKEVLILDKSVKIEKNEKNIVCRAIVRAREQIGINILVEEIVTE